MFFEIMLSTILVLTLTVVYAAPPEIDCGYRLCAKPYCPGGNSYTPAGSCCPVCGEDCRVVRCGPPICAKGEELYTPAGKCCQQCRPVVIDCSSKLCAYPYCPYDNIYSPVGSCCPVCGEDCRLVKCGTPVCSKGQESYTPLGKCCKRCPPINCNLVDCRDPACLDSEELYTPDGECCQQCRPIDCSRVLCPLPKCLDGQELYTPPGECCRTCRYIKKDCVHTNGKTYTNRERFMDKCNTCTCNDGQISCTEMGCLEKGGTCPKPVIFENCSSDTHMCDDDWGCPRIRKCCSNGCGGTVCSILETNGCWGNGVLHEHGDTLPSNLFKPCQRCTCRDGKIGCVSLLCPACQGYTPPGACCPICGSGYLLGSAADLPPSES